MILMTSVMLVKNAGLENRVNIQRTNSASCTSPWRSAWLQSGWRWAELKGRIKFIDSFSTNLQPGLINRYRKTVFALDRDLAGSIKKITVFSLNNGDSCSLVKFNGRTCSRLLLKTQTAHILQHPWIFFFFFFWFFFLFSFVSAGILKTKRNPNIWKLKFANVESWDDFLGHKWKLSLAMKQGKFPLRAKFNDCKIWFHVHAGSPILKQLCRILQGH